MLIIFPERDHSIVCKSDRRQGADARVCFESFYISNSKSNSRLHCLLFCTRSIIQLWLFVKLGKVKLKTK